MGGAEIIALWGRQDGRMDADALVSAARAALPGLLVATDFDGTLAPIVADP